MEAVNYSVDQMVRYAYEYELNNLLKIPGTKISANDDTRKQIIEFMERRISEIKNKHKARD
jgi:hypothetical protein